MAITIKVDATAHIVDVDPDTPLLWVLRDVPGRAETEFGCGVRLRRACVIVAAAQRRSESRLPIALGASRFEKGRFQ